MLTQFQFLIIQAGARLAVHDSIAWPLVDEFGMDISPSTTTLAPIQEVLLYNYRLSRSTYIV